MLEVADTGLGMSAGADQAGGRAVCATLAVQRAQIPRTRPGPRRGASQRLGAGRQARSQLDARAAARASWCGFRRHTWRLSRAREKWANEYLTAPTGASTYPAPAAIQAPPASPRKAAGSGGADRSCSSDGRAEGIHIDRRRARASRRRGLSANPFRLRPALPIACPSGSGASGRSRLRESEVVFAHEDRSIVALAGCRRTLPSVSGKYFLTVASSPINATTVSPALAASRPSTMM